MNIHKRHIFGAALVAFATPAALCARDLPQIRNGQLIVEGRPYLALGGELHNSSASSAEYMEPIWDKLQKLNVKTIVSTATWDDVEPQEGKFDFELVDAQIAQARKRDMRIVLIWFGAFKNATSVYAPTWVRTDLRRFPRALTGGRLKEAFTFPGAMPKPVLSVFSTELMNADRRAFAALMAHIAKADPDNRIIMVQVNNEVGLLGDSRDRSTLASAAWNGPVPLPLLDYLAAHRGSLRPELDELWARQGRRRSGTWPEVFGTDWRSDEVFMAWHFGRYVENMAAAGKKILALPMYTNAWLGPQESQPTAGMYPSGGPTKQVLDVWKAVAPSLDLLAPDIYVPNSKPVHADYHRADNPLFIPEAQFKVGDLFWALGNHAAIGFNPFGIEDGRVGNQISEAYAFLNPMFEVVTKAQAEHRIAGVLLEGGAPAVIQLGKYKITMRETGALLKQMLLDVGLQAPPPPPPLPSQVEPAMGPPAPGDSRPHGFIIDEGGGSFLILGTGFNATFEANGSPVEIDRIEEGKFSGNVWHAQRSLNGDERLAALPMDRLRLVRVRVIQPTGQ